MKETVYIVLEKVAKLSGDKDLKKLNVKLMDVCDVCCSNKDMENKINHLEVTVLDVDGQKHVRKLVSLTDLINIIEAHVDNVDISPVGENQIMLDYERTKSNNKLITTLAVGFMCIFTFIGSAYVIMAYNNDVGTIELFERIYGLLGITDYKETNMIEIAYGVGIALGIIVFYNHFGKMRISDTPTPIQVEMDKYEKDEEESLITQLGKSK